MKWDINKVNQFVFDNSNCVLLSKKYVNNTSKLIFKCECGNEFETTFKEFKGRKDRNYCKRQCNDCGEKIRINKRRKSQKQFEKEVMVLKNREYLVLGKYINANTKIKLQHIVCGHIFYMRPGVFLNSQNCPKCYGTPRKTTEEFAKEVYVLTNGDYDVLGEYVNNKEKILMKHNTCGNIWESTPNQFLRGTYCPKCAVISKGEVRIRNYLEKKNISFEEQFKIKECKHINPLPFDFAIMKNNNLHLLIEYNGEQHFRPTRFSNADVKFKEIIRNDSIKRKYCKENNINLLEIPYMKFNEIEKILNNILL